MRVCFTITNVIKINPSTALRNAAAIAGGIASLARRIGVASSTPSMWLARGAVPAEYCWPIEQAVDGLVKRWDLRPDDWHRIWPELIDADGAPAIPQEVAHG